MVREGYARCIACLRKNVRCDGTFSEVEFGRLESKKKELQLQSREARDRFSSLAYQILSEQKRQAKLDLQLEKITIRQSQMVDQEARLLGELGEVPLRLCWL